MKNYKSVFIIVLLIAALAAIVFFVSRASSDADVKDTDVVVEKTGAALTQEQRESIVTTYIKAKITELSSAQAVLGGTFFVTKVSFSGTDKGSVAYEDGHIALVADFSYSVDDANIAQ